MEFCKPLRACSAVTARALIRLFVQLSSQAKFLIGSDGTVLSRYGPPQSPSSIEGDIVKALDAVPVSA